MHLPVHHIHNKRSSPIAGNLCTRCTNTNCLVQKHVSNPAISELIKSRKEIKCKKGQQFIMEGASVTGLFFLLNGKVKVVRTGLLGREQIVRFATPGEIIGHRGFGTEETYPISAMALVDSSLCYFSKDLLQEILKISPELTYDLMLFYANELNRSEIRVKSLSQMTVRERVIDTLLYINRKFGQNNGYTAIVLSRREYANYAGTTEEQVIRTLSALKKEGLVATKGKRIGLLNIPMLQNEISEHNFYLDS
ncbi:cAMP-binding domain of CRP or a regulatory subunit of cAMP-dependent protein kinases [Maribacter sedimenticola]|uniref:cAMP-binding domain of CRP or a regulatory subunit of cAMP-dependent protein kinases n=1 Tax=Maribacter sedimenticola TaxID=228956 RepID=A0ABY1SJJ2_9FLAO|nr:Crp/Fnr family transcriptional regulator [Maribacter sedimenticola]SNR59947.1 cAMP-binding domain of CRP or a regulatory subunit of cAMP-dependent protein kinases [Maribacter sedimenticola]